MVKFWNWKKKFWTNQQKFSIAWLMKQETGEKRNKKEQKEILRIQGWLSLVS